MAETKTTKTTSTRTDVRKPLYAYVGAADLAVAKLRELPGWYTAELRRRREGAEGFQTQVKELPTQVRAQVKELPQAVRTQLSDLAAKANETYADLAGRGERLVSGVRKDPATQAAVDEGKTAVRQAKGARTSARKAAGSAAKAASDAADKVG